MQKDEIDFVKVGRKWIVVVGGRFEEGMGGEEAGNQVVAKDGGAERGDAQHVRSGRVIHVVVVIEKARIRVGARPSKVISVCARGGRVGRVSRDVGV